MKRLRFTRYGSIEQWRTGDTIAITRGGDTLDGVIARVAGDVVEIDVRPRVMGMPVQADDDIPEGAILFRDGDWVVGKIINLR